VPAGGARERAALVAEQFRLERAGGVAFERVAVEDGERPCLAVGKFVDIAGHVFLTGTRAAADENDAFGVGDVPCLPRDLLHFAGVADDVARAAFHDAADFFAFRLVCGAQVGECLVENVVDVRGKGPRGASVQFTLDFFEGFLFDAFGFHA